MFNYPLKILSYFLVSFSSFLFFQPLLAQESDAIASLLTSEENSDNFPYFLSNYNYYYSINKSKIPEKNQIKYYSDKLNFNYINPYLITSPENFNPAIIPTKIPEKKPENKEPEIILKKRQFFILDSIDTNFFVDTDNYGQRNQFIEPTIFFNTTNTDKFQLKTGVNIFTKPSVETVYNYPLIVGWQTKINDVNLNLNAGLEMFDRLNSVPSIKLNVEFPLLLRVNPNGGLQSLFVLINALEYYPYKFNASTLKNGIKTFKYRPAFYWLITPDVSLFSFSQFGSFNDGNQEYQSFTRLEKTFGEISLALNLFTWSFEKNVEQTSGYFSPSDFLVYNLELAWKKIFNNYLNCGLIASFGQQRLNNEYANAQVYETFCNGNINDKISLGLGYKLSNIRTLDTGETSYLNEQFKGKIQIKF